MELYRRAVRTLPAETPPQERGGILEALAREESARDETAAAAATLTAAREAYDEAGDRLAAARRGLTARGRPAPPRRRLRRGRRRSSNRRSATSTGSAARTATGSSRASRPRWPARRLGRSTGRRRIGTQIARSPLPAGRATWRRSSTPGSPLVAVLPFDGRNDEALETATTVIRRSRELHLDDEAGRAYRIAGAGESEVFEYGPAERMLRDGITFAEQHELWNHRCYMTAHLGLVLWATGRWSEADDVASAASREGRGGVTTRITGCTRGATWRWGGDGSRKPVTCCRSRCRWASDPATSSACRCRCGASPRRRCVAGRFDDAVALTERGRASPRRSMTPPSWRRSSSRAPAPGSRARGLREATSWVDDVGGVLRSSGIATLQPAVDHAHGLIALARGETGQARSHLAAAVDGWDRIGRSGRGPGRAWTWRRATCGPDGPRTRRSSSPMRARSPTRWAAVRSRIVPASCSAMRAAGPGRDRWAPLTAREFDVARLIADGQTNAEIAAELSIAPKTVASHVEHILVKLTATRRTEIAAWASRLGGASVGPMQGLRERA